jgi:hypothetical protein
MEESLSFTREIIGFVPEVCSILRPVMLVEFLLRPSVSIDSLSEVQAA